MTIDGTSSRDARSFRDTSDKGRVLISAVKSKEMPHFSQYLPSGLSAEPTIVYFNGEEGMNANRL